jgi:hypothetical protein
MTGGEWHEAARVIPGRRAAVNRNLEIPGSMLAHRPGMTPEINPLLTIHTAKIAE